MKVNGADSVSVDLTASVAFLAGMVEFLDVGDAIVIVGTGIQDDSQMETFSAAVEELGPVKAFEQLSGEAAPEELVEAQKRVDKVREKGDAAMMSRSPPPPEEESLHSLDKEGNKNLVEDESGDRRLNSCFWDYHRTGDKYWSKYTNFMSGRIEPYRGGLGVALDWWTGSYWSQIISRYANQNGYAYVSTYGSYAHRRVRTYSASGDGYHTYVCWN